MNKHKNEFLKLEPLAKNLVLNKAFSLDPPKMHFYVPVLKPKMMNLKSVPDFSLDDESTFEEDDHDDNFQELNDIPTISQQLSKIYESNSNSVPKSKYESDVKLVNYLKKETLHKDNFNL